MKVKKWAHNYVDQFHFPSCMLDPLDMKELREACAYTQLHALPLAVLAPSKFYSPDFFQSMSRDEPNSKIPLC